LFFVVDSLVRLFGEERPAFTGLREEELIEKIAGCGIEQISKE
jgi:hypothetical protein